MTYMQYNFFRIDKKKKKKKKKKINLVKKRRIKWNLDWCSKHLKKRKKEFRILREFRFSAPRTPKSF